MNRTFPSLAIVETILKNLSANQETNPRKRETETDRQRERERERERDRERQRETEREREREREGKIGNQRITRQGKRAGMTENGQASLPGLLSFDN